MLQQLRIKNFQCHKNLTIDFDEHLTVITGPSDIGKSAILRALQWLCFNRPAGSSFLRHGAKAVSVALVLPDVSLLRFRGRYKNLYRLQGRTFTALGSAGVPEELSRILNTNPDSFGLQHEAPYWLSLSPGQVSRKLNTIVDLSLIDSTLGNLAKELRKARTICEITEQRLTSVIAQRDKLTWVQSADEQLTVLESMEIRLQQKRSRITQIKASLTRVQDTDQALQNASRTHRNAARVIRLGDEILSLRTRHKQLQENLHRITSWIRQESQLRQQLTEVNDRLGKLEGTLCPVCGQEIKTLSPS